MKYILSLDQGTTSSRAILCDSSAKIVATEQFEFSQKFPRQGWVEHDANEIWDTQQRAFEGVLKKQGCGWKDIEAIGIANQRETLVVWNAETGEALGNAIVWQDRRTADLCRKLKAEEGREEWIREKTGLLLDPYFSATKLHWRLRHDKELRSLAEKGVLAVGTIDSWLVWKLSGGRSHVTDVSNASRTLLMNLQDCEWDPELLEFFGIPESCLPEIVDSSGLIAQTAADVSSGVSVPICGIAGDQQAALFGQVCYEKGMVKCTYGTGCFVLMQLGSEIAYSKKRLLTSVAWRIGTETAYALEGSVFMGGASVQWLRDGLQIIEESSNVEALARSVEDSGGVFVVPAFTGLGAPHWDPYARGAVLGLTRGSSKAHVARATLEGIAFQVTDLIEAMEEDSGIEITRLQADGGAAANDLLMQIQADLIGCRVARPAVLETTALGAAFLAGLATGYWKSMEEIASLWAESSCFEDQSDGEQRQKRMLRWTRAIDRAKAWEEEADDED